MCKIDRSAIEEKIKNSRFAADEESNRSVRKSLLALVEELCDYTNAVNQKYIDGAREQGEDSPKIKDVFVALLPAKDEKGNAKKYDEFGLFSMNSKFDDSDGMFHYERVFLDCEYDEIKEFDGKTYDVVDCKDKKGAPFKFSFSLEFDDSFLKAQEILFDYAEHYNVKNPVVFSPYSHKSFYVKYVEQLREDVPELDSLLKESFKNNKIPVIEGKNSLYWNIKQSDEKEKLYDAKEPYGDATKYVFRFEKPDGGNSPLPLPSNNQTRVYSTNVDKDWVDVVIDREIENFTVFEYKDFNPESELAKERRSKRLLFDNNVIEGTWKRHRILSEGDIERAIGCFNKREYKWPDARCERSKKKDKTIVRYSPKYRVDRKAKILFAKIKKIYVSFKETNDKKFLTDIANYVLEYLEYNYPEIKWYGVE